MRRLFWLALGVTVGVLVMRKLSRAAERVSPRGIAETVSSGVSELSETLRDFAADVRGAMREEEASLREGAGFDGRLGALPSAAPSSTARAEDPSGG